MTEPLEEELFNILSWQTPLPLLSNLKTGISGNDRNLPLKTNAALCLDSNIFLRLAGGTVADDIIDYLDNKHSGPIILPSQVIQEFWNNSGKKVEEFADQIQKKSQELNVAIRKVEDELGDDSALVVGAKELVENFTNDFGHVFIAQHRPALVNLMDMLMNRATVTQVQRLRFSDVAKARAMTKTPPGFKDVGDGDFFIWAEFLLGLLVAKNAGRSFDVALFITNDVKKDWSTNGVPHPILSAEVFAAAGVPFGTLTLDDFTRSVKAFI